MFSVYAYYLPSVLLIVKRWRAWQNNNSFPRLILAPDKTTKEKWKDDGQFVCKNNPAQIRTKLDVSCWVFLVAISIVFRNSTSKALYLAAPLLKHIWFYTEKTVFWMQRDTQTIPAGGASSLVRVWAGSYLTIVLYGWLSTYSCTRSLLFAENASWILNSMRILKSTISWQIQFHNLGTSVAFIQINIPENVVSGDYYGVYLSRVIQWVVTIRIVSDNLDVIVCHLIYL